MLGRFCSYPSLILVSTLPPALRSSRALTCPPESAEIYKIGGTSWFAPSQTCSAFISPEYLPRTDQNHSHTSKTSTASNRQFTLSNDNSPYNSNLLQIWPPNLTRPGRRSSLVSPFAGSPPQCRANNPLAECRKLRIAAPQFNIVSDRRGKLGDSSQLLALVPFQKIMVGLSADTHPGSRWTHGLVCYSHSSWPEPCGKILV